jgi:RNA recognition motif-containing protein
MNIFVGNLAFSAKEEDVYKAFAGFGAVANVAIVMEKKGKKSRGFGFVEMPLEQEALSAIAALHGKEILGRPINVMAALPKKPKSERSERVDKKKSFNPQVITESRQEPSFKRTGRYREGRRSISYVKKRIAVGITDSVPERKYKPNPMRWRKKPRWAVSSQKAQGELKPWEKNEGQANPWQKRRGVLKPWKKTEGSQSKPWKKTEGVARPWRKSSGSSQQPRSRRESLSRHKK